jgi:hypothetical protein
MGSHDGAAAPLQQPVFPQQSAGMPSPLSTRRAASPYFSRTTEVIRSAVSVDISLSSIKKS